MLTISGSPVATAVVVVVALLVLGCVSLVAITSWRDVQIARATGQDPRERRDRPDTPAAFGPGEVVDKIGAPPPWAKGGPTD